MSRASVTIGGPKASELDSRQRDFLLLNIFVLVQHGYVGRAAVLAEAMHLLGDDSIEVLLARAVLRFSGREWAAALECLEELDRVDPIERFGSYRLTDRQRMRRYLKTRCLWELKDGSRAKDAMEAYLRRGNANGDDAEG
jgi:hypothetical protein